MKRCSTVALNGVLDLARILGGTKDDDRCHGLDLEASQHERFSLFAQLPAVKAAAWASIFSLLTSRKVEPIVERAYKLDEAAEALRHLIEDRPFGRVVLVP